jgi:hypothetical protein
MDLVGCAIAYGDGDLLKQALAGLKRFTSTIIVGVGRFDLYPDLGEEAITEPVAVARQFGAEVIVPPSFQWGSEADARTRMLAAVPDDAWAMWADADEIWKGEPSTLLPQLESGAGFFWVKMVRSRTDQPLYIPRLFQKQTGQKFVHDYLVRDPDGTWRTLIHGTPWEPAVDGTELEGCWIEHLRDQRPRERLQASGEFLRERRSAGYGTDFSV